MFVDLYANAEPIFRKWGYRLVIPGLRTVAMIFHLIWDPTERKKPFQGIARDLRLHLFADVSMDLKKDKHLFFIIVYHLAKKGNQWASKMP